MNISTLAQYRGNCWSFIIVFMRQDLLYEANPDERKVPYFYSLLKLPPFYHLNASCTNCKTKIGKLVKTLMFCLPMHKIGDSGLAILVTVTHERHLWQASQRVDKLLHDKPGTNRLFTDDPP